MKKDNSGISQPTTTNQASQPPTSMTYQSTTYTRPKDKPMLLVDIFTRPVYDDIQLWKILYEKPKDIDFKLPRTFAGIVKGAVMKYIAVGDPANAEGEPTLSDGSANNRDNLRYVEIDGTPSLQLQRTNLKAGNTDIELTGVDEDDKRNKLKSIKHVDDDIITTIEGPDIDIPKPNLYGYSITDSTKPVEYNIDWDKLKLLTDDNNNNNNPDVIRKYYSALYYKHPELNIEAPNLDIEKPNVKGTSITESTKPVEREYDNISSLILNYARLDEYRTLVFDNDVNIKPENELDIIKPNLNGDNIHDKIELNQVEVDPNLLLLDLNRPEWIVNGILHGVQQEKFDVETNDIDIIPPNLKGDNVDGDVKVCSPGVDEDSLLIDLNQPQLKYEGILRKVKDEVDVQATGIDVVKPDLNGNVIDEEKVTLVQPEVEKDLELLVLDKDDAVRRYLLKQYKRKILDLDVYGPELECERVELKGDNVKDKIMLRYPIVNENEVLIDIKDQPIKGIIEGKDEEVDIKAPELVKPNITYISGIIEGKKEEKEELEKPDIDIVKPNLMGYPIKEEILPLTPDIDLNEPLLELEKPKERIIGVIGEQQQDLDVLKPDIDIVKPNLYGYPIREDIVKLTPGINLTEPILELKKPEIIMESISGIIEGEKPQEEVIVPELNINKPNLEAEQIQNTIELIQPEIKTPDLLIDINEPKPEPQIIKGVIEGKKEEKEDLEKPDIDIVKPNLPGYPIREEILLLTPGIRTGEQLLELEKPKERIIGVIGKQQPDLDVLKPDIDIVKPNLPGYPIKEQVLSLSPGIRTDEPLLELEKPKPEIISGIIEGVKPQEEITIPELDINKPNLEGDKIEDKIELVQPEIKTKDLLLNINEPKPEPTIIKGVIEGEKEKEEDLEKPDIDIIKPNLSGYSITEKVLPLTPGIRTDELLLELEKPKERIIEEEKPDLDVLKPDIDIVKPNLKGYPIKEQVLPLSPGIRTDEPLLELDQPKPEIISGIIEGVKPEEEIIIPKLNINKPNLKTDKIQDTIELIQPEIKTPDLLIDINKPKPEPQIIKGVIEGKQEEKEELEKPDINIIKPNLPGYPVKEQILPLTPGIDPLLELEKPKERIIGVFGEQQQDLDVLKPDIDIVKPNLPGYPIKEQVLPLSPGIRKDEPLLELEKPKPQIISGIIEGVKPKDEEKDITVPEFDIHKPNLEGDKIKEKIELLSPGIKKDEPILELEKPKIKEETISGIIEGIKPTEDNITIPALDINKPNLEGEKIKDKIELLSPGIKSNEPILELEKPKPQIISGIIEGIKPQEEIITTPSIEKPKDEYELIKPDINIIGPNLKGTNIKDKIEIKPPQLDPNNKLLELKKPTNILKGAVIGTKDPNTTVPTPSLDITKPNLKGTNINDKIELLPPHLPPTEQLLELKKPEIQKPIIDDNDDNNFNIETKEIDIKGPFFDINFPERQGQGIKEKENEIEIPKLNLNTPPIVKDDTPEIEFKPPVLNIEEPKIETDVNIKKPEIKIPKTQPIVHKTIEHEIPIEINKPEVKVPVIKGGVLDLHAPLLSLSAPEFNLRKPNVDGSKIKSKVKEVSPEYDTNNKPTVESPKSNKGFSLKGLIGGNLPGILNLNNNKPEIKPPIIGNDDKLKGPTIKGGIDVDNKQEIKINAPNVELNKPDLKGPKIKETTTEHNITKPTIKEGLDIEPTYTPDKITIPTIKGVDDNMKLSLPKRRNGLVDLITRPLDEELNVNKKEIHKPKDIPFKMPELVVPVPSIGEGIDVNAPKIDTITTPQLKGPVYNVNKDEPTAKGDVVYIPSLHGGVDVNIANKPDSFVEMIEMPIDDDIIVKRVEIPKGKNIEVNVPKDKLWVPKIEGRIDKPETKKVLPVINAGIDPKKLGLNINEPKVNEPIMKGVIGGNVPEVQIPVLKGGVNVNEPVTEIDDVDRVPNLQGGVNSKMLKRPSCFVEMIQKPIDSEINVGKLERPKPKVIDVNVSEDKLAINMKKHELKLGIDAPTVVVPSIGSGIDLRKPKVDGRIDVDSPSGEVETTQIPILKGGISTPNLDIQGKEIDGVDLNIPTIPSIQGGLDIDLPNKPDNFVEMIQKPVDHELKLGKVDIPKPKELEVNVPEEKLAINWKKPELQDGIDTPIAVLPALGAGIDSHKPKVESRVNIEVPEIKGVDIPNIDSGLDINLPNKPDNFVEMIEKPIDHKFKVGKLERPKPKELKVNVPEEKLAINWKKEIPNLKGGINVDTPTVDVPEIKGVEVVVPNINGGLDIELPNKPDNFVEMIQKPIDHEFKVGKLDRPKPKIIDVNVPEEKLAINWKKPALTLGIDSPEEAVPSLGAGIELHKPKVESGIDLQVPEIKGVEMNVPNIDGGLNVDLLNKPDNFVEMIQKPVDHELKLKKPAISKPKEIEVNVPEEKLAINWKKPGLTLGIDAPTVEVPSLENGIDLHKPKVETGIDLQVPEIKGVDVPNIDGGLDIDLPNKPDNFVDMIQKPVDHELKLGKVDMPKHKELEVNVPEEKLAINWKKEVPNLKGGINVDTPTVDVPEITGVEVVVPNINGGLDIELPNKPDNFVEMIQKPVDHELKLGKVDIPKPKELEVNVPEEKLAINWKKPGLTLGIDAPAIAVPSIGTGIDLQKPTVDINSPEIEIISPGLELNKPTIPTLKGPSESNGPVWDIHAPSLDIAKPEIKGDGIKGNIKLVSPEFDPKKPSLNIKQTELKIPQLKGGVELNEPSLDINKPVLKGGLDVDHPEIEAKDVAITIPTIKGVDDNMKLSLPKRRNGLVDLITRPLDEELNVNKKEIHKPKNIPFKMPELVVPVPSIGEGIDVNAPKVDTITIPQLKGGIDVNEGNINISEPYVDVNTPTVPILKGGININSPSVDINGPKIDGVNVPNIDGGLDINLNKPDNFVEMIQKPVEHELKLGKVDILKPKELKVNVPEEKLAINWKKEIPNLKGGINVDTPTVDVPEITGVEVVVPNINGGLDIELPNKPDNFVEMIQKPVDHELKLGKVDIPKPKELEVNVPEEKLAINWKKPELQGGIDSPAIAVPSLGAGIDLQKPKVESEIDVNVPTVNIETPSIPSIQGGLDIELPNKPDNFVELIQKSVDQKLKLGKVDIPKPKELEVSVPEEKLAYNWKKPELQGGIDSPHAVSVPTLEAGIDVQQPKIEGIDINSPNMDMNTQTIPILKGGINTPNLYINTPEIQGTDVNVPNIDGGLDINLNKPNNFVEMIQKPVEHELKLGKVDIPKPKELEVNVPEEKLAINWRKEIPNLKEGINVETPTVDVPEIKGVEVNVPNIDGGLDIDLPNKPDNFVDMIQKPIAHELKLGKVDIPKPKELEVNVPEEKLAINWKKEIPNLKGGINVDTPTVDVPEIKGVEVVVPNINGGLDIELPNKPDNFVEMIEKPVDHDLKLGKVDIPKPKELEVNVPEEKLAINWKKPELQGGINAPVVEVPSLGTGIDIQQPKVETGIDVNSPSLDIVTPTIPILKGGINTDTPTVDLKDGVDLNIPNIQAGLGIDLPNKPDNFVEMIQQPVDHDINLGKLQLPKPKEIEVNVPEDKLAINLNKPGLTLGIDAPAVEVPSLGAGINQNIPNIETGVDLNIPNIEGGLNIDLPDKPNCFVEMIQQPVDHDITLGKLQLPKPEEIEVNVPEDKRAINLNKPELKLGIDAPTVAIPSLETGIDKPTVELDSPEVDINPPELNIPSLKGGINTSNIDVKSPELKTSNLKLPDISGGIDVNFAPQTKRFVDIIQRSVKEDINLNKVDFEKPKEIEFTLPKPSFGLQSPRYEDEFKPQLHEPSIRGTIGSQKQDVDIDFPIETNKKEITLKAPQLDDEIDFNIPQLKEPHIRPPYVKDMVEIPVTTDIKLDKLEIPRSHELNVTIPRNKLNNYINNQNIGDNIDIKSFKLPQIGELNMQKPKLEKQDKKLNGKIIGKVPEVDVGDSSIKLNKPQLKGPNNKGEFELDMPKLDLNAPSLDIKKPDLKGSNIKGNVEVKPPEIKIQKPKKDDLNIKGVIPGNVPNIEVKKPKLFFEMAQEPVECDIKLDKFEMPKPDDLKIAVPKGNIKPPQLKIEKEKPKIIMPSLEKEMVIQKPQLKAPHIQEPEIKIKEPEIKIKEPEIKIKEPEIKIKEPEIKIKEPEIDINIKEPEINIKEPKINLNFENPQFIESIENEGDEINLNKFEPQGISLKGVIKGKEENIPNIDKPQIEFNQKIPEDKKGRKAEGNQKYLIDMVEIPVEDDIKIDKLELKRTNEIDVTIPRDLLFNDIRNSHLKGNQPSSDLNTAKIQMPSISGNLDINKPKIKLEGPNLNLKNPELNLPDFKGNNIDIHDIDIKPPELKDSNYGASFNLKSPEIDIKKQELKDSNNVIGSLDLSLPKLQESHTSLKPEINIKDSVNINLPKQEEQNIPNLELKSPEIKLKGSALSNVNPKESIDFENPLMKGIIQGNTKENMKKSNAQIEAAIEMDKILPEEFEDLNDRYLIRMLEEPVEKQIKLDKINIKKSNLVDITVPRDRLSGKLITSDLGSSKLKNSSIIDNNPSIPEPRFSATHKKK